MIDRPVGPDADKLFNVIQIKAALSSYGDDMELVLVRCREMVERSEEVHDIFHLGQLMDALHKSKLGALQSAAHESLNVPSDNLVQMLTGE